MSKILLGQDIFYRIVLNSTLAEPSKKMDNFYIMVQKSDNIVDNVQNSTLVGWVEEPGKSRHVKAREAKSGQAK